MKKVRVYKKKKILKFATFGIVLLMVGLILTVKSPAIAGDADSAQSCVQTVEMLRSQKKEMSREFRQIKRELALVKETIGKPGISEILGGIGFILGLFGVSYYWHARNLIKGKK